MSTWVLVGTLPGGAGGGANVLPRQTVGVSQSVVADLGRFPIEVGVSVEQAPTRLVVPQVIGVSIDDLVSGDPALPLQSVGVAVSSKADGEMKAPVSVGTEIQQWVTNLTQTTYATTAGSSGRWTNAANATGPNNGTVATANNSITVAASGSLELSYAAQFNKTELTISKVELHRYWQNAAGLVTPSTWLAEYSLNNGASWTLLATGTTSFNQMTSPGIEDITAAVGGDWNKLSQLRVRFTYTGGASATPSTLTVDAVKLIVTASRVDNL